MALTRLKSGSVSTEKNICLLLVTVKDRQEIFSCRSKVSKSPGLAEMDALCAKFKMLENQGPVLNAKFPVPVFMCFFDVICLN